MRALKKLFVLGLIVFLCQVAMAPLATSFAKEKMKQTDSVKKIVMFQEGVSTQERAQYAADWAFNDVSVIMDLPLINGMILLVPKDLDNDALANDVRVKSIENNKKTKIGKAEKKADKFLTKVAKSSDEVTQTFSIAGDGGSGDGGSGDGGSGDGGSGDGGSYDATMFTAVEPLSEYERPWGILDLYDLFYDPAWQTYKFEDTMLPEIVNEALSYNTQVKVAILDTGINYGHPDVIGSVAGGVDFVNMVNAIPMDYHGHGTHVAGTLVSPQTGGVSGNAAIYAVKILQDDASGDIATLLMGLQWAVENGMDIIHMSVAFAENNKSVYDMVNKANSSGIIMVAAAGNHSNWEDDTIAGDGGSGDGGSGDGGSLAYDPSTGTYPVMYPAAYNEVIAVGAMDSYEQEASFSNTGPEVDVLAPGVDVVSTVGLGYGSCNGTSMAAPHVTGAVIMMQSLAKANCKVLTPKEAKEIIGLSSFDGSLNLVGALEEVKYVLSAYDKACLSSDLTVYLGGPISINPVSPSLSTM